MFLNNNFQFLNTFIKWALRMKKKRVKKKTVDKIKKILYFNKI